MRKSRFIEAQIGAGGDRHMITAAGSSGGKDWSSVIPTVLSDDGSTFNFDPKTELSTTTAQARAEELGQEVFVPGPFNVTRG